MLHGSFDNQSERGRVGRGLCLWLVLVPLIVAIRGVRWDEAFEHSAVLAGVVTYPQGHPLTQALFNQYTLQNYPAALLQLLGLGPAIINGFRNAISLYAVVLPVYLVAAAIGGRGLLGHAAALLALQGVYLTFDSVYPMEVWPPFTSFGHIGMGYALTALGVLVWRRSFSGGLLAGLTPLIHIGQFPPLLATLGLLWPLALLRKRFGEAGRLAGGVLLAVALCAGFWFWHQATMLEPPPETGPYAAEGNVAQIHQNFTATMDNHRAPPGVNSHIILLAALGLAIATWRVMGGEARRRAEVALLYIALCAAVVYGTLMTHLVMGAETPFLLLAWMPYRVMNHAAPVALALSVALLGTIGGRWGSVLLYVTIVAAAGRWFVEPVLPGEVYARYLFDGELFLFVLMGAAGAMALARDGGRAVSVVLMWIAVGALAVWHQAGAAALAAGMAYGLLAGGKAMPERTDDERPAPSPARWRMATAVVALLVAAGLTGAQQWKLRQHLLRTPFELNVEREVREGGPPWAMLLADPGNLYVQCVYGVPVILAQTTFTWISYMPRLGPVIDAMYADIYGIRFDYEPDPNWDGDPLTHPLLSGFYTWHETWRERSAEEWRALGRKWGFHYIIAPENDPLQLDELLHADGLRFYRVEALEAGPGMPLTNDDQP